MAVTHLLRRLASTPRTTLSGALLLGALVLPAPALAQVEAAPVLEGRVVLGERAGGGVPTDATSETVVLHRVGPDTAGALDSLAVRPDGGFSFRLPTVPDPGGRGEVYFVSVEHQGIMYFGDAVTTAVQLDSLYRIEVYDTVSAPPGGADLPVAIRYIVLESLTGGQDPTSPSDGEWQVTDLIQVENPGNRTLVPREEGGVVFTAPLPVEAVSPRVGAGATGPDAVRIVDGRLVVEAPLPPGPRQFIVRYGLPSPEVTFELPGTTDAAELLIREPAPPLTVDGLEASEPADMGSGITYRRYAGTALQDGRIVVAPGEEGGGGIELSPRWLAVVLALLLGGVGVWAAVGRTRSGQRGSAAESHEATLPSDERNALLLEVAEVDERLEAGVADADEEARLRALRKALLERLRASR